MTRGHARATRGNRSWEGLPNRDRSADRHQLCEPEDVGVAEPDATVRDLAWDQVGPIGAVDPDKAACRPVGEDRRPCARAEGERAVSRYAPISAHLELGSVSPATRLASARASGARRSVLLGTHAQNAHSPPTSSRSTSATLRPLPRSLLTTASPAGPPPRITTSKFMLERRTRARRRSDGTAKPRRVAPLHAL